MRLHGRESYPAEDGLVIPYRVQPERLDDHLLPKMLKLFQEEKEFMHWKGINYINF